MLDAVVIVGGSIFSVGAVKAAKELGLLPIVVDKNPNAPAILQAIFDAPPLLHSIYDPAAIIKALETPLMRLHNLKGVFTCGHDAEVTVATIAEHFGLPGIPVDAALNCKDKLRTRQCLERAGVSQPRPVRELWSGRYEMPFIVKPVDACASRGTTIVDDEKDLREATIAAVRASATGEYMLEEYLEGAEYSVEILFDGEGKCHHLNIVSRVFEVANGIPMEVGHVNPYNTHTWLCNMLYDLAEKAAKAVGVNFGAFKIDAILRWGEVGSDSLAVLEVTARLSGGFDSSHTTPLATGRNFIKAAMRVACGMPFDPADLEVKHRKYAACYCPLTGEEQSNADRKEFRLAVGDTYDEAWQKAKDGVDLVEVIRK